MLTNCSHFSGQGSYYGYTHASSLHVSFTPMLHSGSSPEDVQFFEIFKCTYSQNLLSMATSKHTRACAQRSPASVGLAQARPNYRIAGNFREHKFSQITNTPAKIFRDFQFRDKVTIHDYAHYYFAREMATLPRKSSLHYNIEAIARG